MATRAVYSPRLWPAQAAGNEAEALDGVEYHQAHHERGQLGVGRAGQLLHRGLEQQRGEITPGDFGGFGRHFPRGMVDPGVTHPGPLRSLSREGKGQHLPTPLDCVLDARPGKVVSRSPRWRDKCGTAASGTGDYPWSPDPDRRGRRLERVPGAGFEPARPFGQWILSPPRLPFRHPGPAGLSYLQVRRPPQRPHRRGTGAWLGSKSVTVRRVSDRSGPPGGTRAWAERRPVAGATHHPGPGGGKLRVDDGRDRSTRVTAPVCRPGGPVGGGADRRLTGCPSLTVCRP